MPVIHQPHDQLGKGRVAGVAIAVALIGVGMTGLAGAPSSSEHRSPVDIVRFAIDGR
jgi:hypothetical protein